MFERVDGLFQVPSRQVQVDAGRFQIGVPNQDLDGRQIGAIFQQVRAEAVPEHMRRDAFLQPRMPSGFDRVPDGLIGKMILATLFKPTRKEPALASSSASTRGASLAASGIRERRNLCRLYRDGCERSCAGCQCPQRAAAPVHCVACPSNRAARGWPPSLEIAGGVNQLRYPFRTEDFWNAMDSTW